MAMHGLGRVLTVRTNRLERMISERCARVWGKKRGRIGSWMRRIDIL